jgi:hypothetical protein
MLTELHWVVESLQVVPLFPPSVVGEQQNGDPEEQVFCYGIASKLMSHTRDS